MIQTPENLCLFIQISNILNRESVSCGLRCCCFLFSLFNKELDIYPQKIIIYVRLAGSSTTHQGKQKQSCLFMHLVKADRPWLGCGTSRGAKLPKFFLPELRKKCRVLITKENHTQRSNESPAFPKGNSSKPLQKNTFMYTNLDTKEHC